MTSFASRLVKRIKEKTKPRVRKPERYVELAHGNFDVYHPTKGWRQVSGKRYWALVAMSGVGK